MAKLMTSQDWINLLLAMAAALGPAVTVYLARQNWRKTGSEITLNKRQEAKLSQEIENKSEEKFQAEIDVLKKEVATLRRYINRHIPWDWQAVRELKLAGIEIEDPPDLNYLEDEDVK
jgi:hypothetical protein